MLSASRVAARFIAETQLAVQDEGRFILEYLPKHSEAVGPIIEKVHKAIDTYRKSGIEIQHKVLVRLHGKGASKADALYWNGSNPPLIVIAPKAYRDPILVKTIIHEFGHYLHDKVVPGGTGNPTIKSRYVWALRQKATGEGPKKDVIIKRIKDLEADLRDLDGKRLILKPIPKKGEPFEFDHWVSGAKLHLKGKIIRKSGDKVTLEVLNPEVIPFNISGYFPKRRGVVTIEESAKSLFFTGVNLEVEKAIKEKTAERSQLYAELNGITRTEQDDRYESQRHEWAPTKYSRTNYMEWFAELCTTLALGHLKDPVDRWLLSVIRTGGAPDDLVL